MHLRSYNSKFIGIAFIATMSLAIFAPSADAATVTKVKGNQVMLESLDSEGAVNPGDKFFVMIDGKKRGLVEITKVKGIKAIGKIIKGRAEVNAELQPVGAASGGSSKVAKKGNSKKRSKKSSADGDDSGESKSSLTGLSVGAVAGLGMDSQTVTTTATSIAMSGMGYSVKAFGDLPIYNSLGGIVRLGLEQMNLSGSGGASTSILYVTGDVLARYTFLDGDFIPYVAGGMSLLMPMTQSSNVLGSISMVMTFVGDVGLRYYINKETYLIGVAEYNYFPAAASVTTNIISVRGGMGFSF